MIDFIGPLAFWVLVLGVVPSLILVAVFFGVTRLTERRAARRLEASGEKRLQETTTR